MSVVVHDIDPKDGTNNNNNSINNINQLDFISMFQNDYIINKLDYRSRFKTNL